MGGNIGAATCLLRFAQQRHNPGVNNLPLQASTSNPPQDSRALPEKWPPTWRCRLTDDGNRSSPDCHHGMTMAVEEGRDRWCRVVDTIRASFLAHNPDICRNSTHEDKQEAEEVDEEEEKLKEDEGGDRHSDCSTVLSFLRSKRQMAFGKQRDPFSLALHLQRLLSQSSPQGASSPIVRAPSTYSTCTLHDTLTVLVDILGPALNPHHLGSPASRISWITSGGTTSPLLSMSHSCVEGSSSSHQSPSE